MIYLVAGNGRMGDAVWLCLNEKWKLKIWNGEINMGPKNTKINNIILYVSYLLLIPIFANY